MGRSCSSVGRMIGFGIGLGFGIGVCSFGSIRIGFIVGRVGICLVVVVLFVKD